MTTKAVSNVKKPFKLFTSNVIKKRLNEDILEIDDQSFSYDEVEPFSPKVDNDIDDLCIDDS